MDWKTLNAFDFSKKIYRKPEVQKKYEGEMNKYLNYEKYILNKFLNNKLYNLQPNTYPYDLQPNIKHCVLWLNPIINKDILYKKKFIEGILKSYIPNKEFIFYMNSQKNKSIKQIPHYHVFIKMN